MTPGNASASSAPVPYPPPFSVQGSCELGEDYFLTSQLILQPAAGDLVRPFTRQDGTVEALVLIGGNLGYLHHDPAATSGWSYTVLSGLAEDAEIPDDITDVAVGTDTTYGVTGIYSAADGTAVGALNFDEPSGTWSSPGYPVPGEGLSRFRADVDPAGYLYFYARDAAGTVWLYQPNGIDFDVQGASGPDVGGISDAWVLWNPEWDPATTAAAGILLTDSQGHIEWYAQSGATSFETSPSLTDGPGTLLWAGRLQDDPGDPMPQYAYRAPSGDIYVDGARIASSGAQLGPDKVAVWESEGLYTLAMLFGDTVNIMAQYGAGQVTSPIPLQPGVTAVFSQPADPAQGTLFVLLDDATLSVLSRDPGAGWSLVPVLQDNPALQQLDGWRVQLAVTDANGAPVAGAVATVTADRPAGTWQASGNTIIGPQSPAAFTADGLGRITFATPAVELDTAQLTVQVLRGGEPSGPPVTVSPDAGVHAFLAGTAPLNDLGALTPAALLAATSASNTPLCPVLTGLPADVQVGAAQAVISAITRCITAGQGVTPGPADIKSFILDLSGAVPKYCESAEPAGIQAVQSLSGWWDSVQNDFDSFAHGLRHGAIKIATCAASWVEDEAGDAYHWAVSLAVTIADDIAGTASYLITDMKSALHAVTGFFQKLGADIGDAISWLRHNGSELIKETGQNAAQVEQWLSQLPTTVSNQLTKYGDLAKDYFASLEATIDTAIDGLLPRLEGLTFASPLPPAATRQLAGSADTAAWDIEKFLLGVQRNWLLDKIMSFSSGDTPAAQNPALQAALGQLAAALQDGLYFALDVGDLLWTGLKELFESRGSYDNTTFAQLFTILKATVHDLLAFADAIVQALLNLAKAAMDQLGSMLSHQLNEIPLVGSLLQHFGVDATMSAAHLTSLILMYPATLANRTKNGSGTPLFPATGATAAENLAAGQVDWAGGLVVSAAVGQFVWGVADAFADGDRARGEEPSGVIGWIDIVAPLILSILGWPGAPNADGTTAPPFANPIDSSGPDGGLIWPTWLVGFVPPIAGLCGQFADYQPADADDEEDWPEIGQYFTMVSAIAGIITGSIYNFQTGQSSNVQAAGILGNISNIIAPFATENLATETDGASAVIKLFVDAAGNLGAAIAMEA